MTTLLLAHPLSQIDMVPQIPPLSLYNHGPMGLILLALPAHGAAQLLTPPSLSLKRFHPKPCSNSPQCVGAHESVPSIPGGSTAHAITTPPQDNPTLLP